MELLGAAGCSEDIQGLPNPRMSSRHVHAGGTVQSFTHSSFLARIPLYRFILKLCTLLQLSAASASVPSVGDLTCLLWTAVLRNLKTVGSQYRRLNRRSHP